MLQLPPLSLYIHFPWCVKKCPYCDFNSHALKMDLPEEYYIKQLITDLENDLIYLHQRPIESIFLGGGTPSLFSAPAIANLISQLRSRLDIKSSTEITLEANPGTVEQNRFHGFLQAGINRLSLGIQSLSDVQLKNLGRIHDSQTAKHAVHAAYAAGFKNINLDLMFGLPQQTLTQALADLKDLLAFKPAHLSWYQLTLEPNTLFYKYPPNLPKDDNIAAMQEKGITLLQQHGYQQYEISAFAKPSLECQHNLNYWRYGDYLGIGAGAHSKLTDREQNRIIRLIKHKHPQQYISADNDFIQKREFVKLTERGFEFMLNALRLYQPIAWQDFTERTGLSPDVIKPTLKKAAAKNLLTFDDQQMSTTTTGKRFLNELLELFLPVD